MLLTVVEGSSYVGDVFQHYFDKLRRRFDRFDFVVVLDDKGRAVAHVPCSTVAAWTEEVRDAFLGNVTAMNQTGLAHTPGFVEEPTQASQLLTFALTRMLNENVHTLLVVDRARRPTGVLELTAAEAALLLSLME